MALPTASDNEFPKVILEEVANDGSATVTPAADHRALFLGEDGTLHLKDSAAAVTDIGGGTPDAHAASHENGGSDEIDVTGLVGAGGGSAAFYYLDSQAAGADQAFPSGGLWADLFPTQMTASVPAATNDILRLEFNCQTTDSDGQLMHFDFTIAGSRVGATAQGVYFFNAADNVVYTHRMDYIHKVAAGDISGGNVAVKVQIKSSVNTVPDVKYTAPVAVLVVTNLGASS